MLVNGSLKLLSRDREGNLHASRVMQLRGMADETIGEMFAYDVKIIETAYCPAVSKFYVRAEKKNDKVLA